MADFDEAIDRVVGGLERRSRLINPREKEIVAHHGSRYAGQGDRCTFMRRDCVFLVILVSDNTNAASHELLVELGVTHAAEVLSVLRPPGSACVQEDAEPK